MRLLRDEDLTWDPELRHRPALDVDEAGCVRGWLDLDVAPSAEPGRSDLVNEFGDSVARSLHGHDDQTTAGAEHAEKLGKNRLDDGRRNKAEHVVVHHDIERSVLERERPGHTLQPTALVNEAYLRLVDVRRVSWKDRTHFLAMSARLMRRVLVDFARSRRSQKRGGGGVKVSLDEAHGVPTERGQDLVALDEALTTLAAIDERKARVIEMRFFGGLTVEETAELLGCRPGTVASQAHRALEKLRSLVPIDAIPTEVTQ